MDRSIELRCLSAGILLFAAIALMAPNQALSQDKYITVDAKELVSAPHRHWARAILFRDKLVSLPAGRAVKVDRKRYIPFDTEIVGKCYAAATVVETLKKLETGRSYAFSGSVFQHRGRYYIIVHGVDKTIDAGEMLREMQASAPDIDPDIQEKAVKPIADVVWTVESSHLAYAKEQDIPLCELYDPQSIHYSKAVELVRSAILEKEQDDSTVSSEMLAQYIVLALAKSCANTNLVAAGKPAGSIETQTQVPMPQPQLSTTEDSGQPEETDLGPAEKSAPPPMFTPPGTNGLSLSGNAAGNCAPRN